MLADGCPKGPDRVRPTAMLHAQTAVTHPLDTTIEARSPLVPLREAITAFARHICAPIDKCHIIANNRS